jgi:hypothetical protein
MEGIAENKSNSSSYNAGSTNSLASVTKRKLDFYEILRNSPDIGIKTAAFWVMTPHIGHFAICLRLSVT